MNAGPIPTMPEGLPDPQPVAGDIDPLLRLMRENQELTAALQMARDEIATHAKTYVELREHAGRQLTLIGEHVTLVEQGRRRIAGQATKLAQALNALVKACPGDPQDPVTNDQCGPYLKALAEAKELLKILPPEMK